ncbi:cystathionine beta-synthase [candidate division KSB1 bacterium]|nr:cystathionine beta-synthase [candidate division KSB1 bacterium]NIR72940.1 cystathionine beta-synthase [candidate division KSB1 bacterium]NIS28239.1 cystathionine beta-synthase [candidate division KSB1 bacterium]NIT75128.1 cystathionine beta-synthase [candidate division KSB1 bacterium]NIU28916.1 cystathionine beta-synthase [candidate division KSB1 bacterium]
MNNGILNSILETVGNTPLIRLNRVTAGIKATVLAKVEYFNPGGSVKDRIALTIIEEAEKEGRLKPGGTIVESTSGNTGAGLALVAALKGYKAIFTMPDKMSAEKVRLLKAYGADVIVTPTSVPPESPDSYYEVAKRIVREMPNAILANQYFNPVNPEAHYKTTGPEIWEQTGGKIDYFVAGLGTGGTISGTGKFLKEKNPKVKVIGADPIGSILKEYFDTKKMSQGRPYKIEGIGEDIIPGTLHFEYIDEVHQVSDKQSFNMARKISREEGIFVGGSSGTAAYVALKVARSLPEDKVVLVILPDTGERYLSKFYSDEWMRENLFFDIEKISLKRVLDMKDDKLPNIISVTPKDNVRVALEKMRNFNISQLPVMEDGRSVGSLEEGSVMGQVIENSALLESPVKEIMQESFPTIGHTASIEDARNYFSQRHAAVLIEEMGRIVGILTKSDLLDFIAS